MTFNDARYISRMSLSEIANYLDLSERTVQNYQKYNKAPKAVIECLMMIGGYCPTFSRRNDFTGWMFSNGYLVAPNGELFDSGEVRASKIANSAFASLHRTSVRNRQKEKEAKPSNIIQFPTNGRNSKLHEPERVKNNDGF